MNISGERLVSEYWGLKDTVAIFQTEKLTATDIVSRNLANTTLKYLKIMAGDKYFEIRSQENDYLIQRAEQEFRPFFF